MKLKALIVFLFILAFASTALSASALWDHSETASVFKYRIAWGTAEGNYTQSQEMLKSACVAGTHPTGGQYDCKLPLTGSFTVNTKYYFVGYAINYDQSGNEQPSPPTAVVTFTPRDPGTVGEAPLPMRDIGVYDN